MNSFGRIFRVHIFGESHGESVGIVLDGCPAGLALSEEDLLPDLERRKGGKQKGTTPRQEADYPFFKSGLFNGKTTGAPITIIFDNSNIRSSDYDKQRSIPRPVTLIGWPIKNMGVMKITAVADISVQG
jgi:chorismate synthase